MSVFVSFFFKFRSLSVGTVSGYQLFAMSSVESLDKIYQTGMSLVLVVTMASLLCSDIHVCG